ncbi:GPI alpha-1,4-mannosyltransferase I, catalytic subunit-like [Saccoglossus kowalevskii]|uniref:GPI alpha-1,4-mannosyltransferase I, catalytic subunit n=1 Tax=Saccoglossus kowalevskii TaxID=10224 RepID=A0ABM0MHJ5_SACKO|nr:PREDICTED: GPI mannosyltransferase 1-like [Saccoglossus kowalevskii]
MKIRTALMLIASWFFGQALWLLPAFYLEMEGYNTFISIFLAGIAFFIINIFILNTVIRAYIPSPLFRGGRLTTLTYRKEQME